MTGLKFSMRKLACASICGLALSGCASEAELAMRAPSAAEAAAKVPLTPALRLDIAKAVYDSQLALHLLPNHVLNSEISAAKDDYAQNAYRAFYCVRLVIERPLIDWHTVFAVYPTDVGGGRYQFRLAWRNQAAATECALEHDLNPFPELRALVEHHPVESAAAH